MIKMPVMPKEKVKRYLDDLLINLEVNPSEENKDKIVKVFGHYREYFNYKEIEKYKNKANKIIGKKYSS